MATKNFSILFVASEVEGLIKSGGLADVAKAVAEFAAGKGEFRNDAGGNIHVVVGKQSFEKEKLMDNIDAFISHIKKIKPSASKGTYIKKVSISATMSPGITIDV